MRIALALLVLSLIGSPRLQAQQPNSMLKRQASDNYQSNRNDQLLREEADRKVAAPAAAGYLQAKPHQAAEAHRAGGTGSKSYYLNDTTMMVSAQVLLNVPADAYTAVFALVQVGQDLPTADNLMAARIENFKRELAKLGIPAENVFVDMIAIEPKFETTVEKRLFSKNAVETPAGFELAKNVHVMFSTEDLLGKIVSAAVAAEIYDLVKVDYFVNDLEGHYSKMRKDCVKLIMDKKAAYSQLGVDFDTTYTVVVEDDFASYYPIDRYMDYLAYSRTSLDALRGKTVASAERNRTQFYHKLSYNGYDKVGNASVLIPPIQLTYSMQAKYVLRRNRLDARARAATPPVQPVGIKVEDGVKVVVPSSMVR